MEVELWLMVARRLLFWMVVSSTPVTVTVCAVFQLLVVNVKVAGLTVAIDPLLDVTLMRTSAFASMVGSTT